MNDLAEQLKRQLTGCDKQIAVAESLTGGHLQSAITSVSGSSNYFVGGVTAYNIDQKVNLLGVVRDHAASVNCVSSKVAEEMAAGVRTMFGSEIGVATTGYAEPWPDGRVDQPFAFFAIDVESHVECGRIDVPDRSRIEVQRFVADEVLKRLISFLKRHRHEP